MPATVSIARAADYRPETVSAALDEALGHLGGLATYVKPGMNVLVKPNLLAAVPPERGTTTHPEVLRAVLRRILEIGAKPVVGDSPSMGSARRAARASGLLAVCDELGAPLIEFNKPRKVDNPGGRVYSHLTVDAAALDADAIVSLPKVKAHQQCYFTCAVKNVFGCVSGKRKALWHLKAGNFQNYFAYMLVENWSLLRPALSIADGIIAMDGQGPNDGRARPLGVLVAGTDAPAIDRVLLEIIGADPLRFGQYLAAKELGLGTVDLGQIDVRGASVASVQVNDFQMPKLQAIGFSLPRVVRSTLKGTWIKAMEHAGQA